MASVHDVAAYVLEKRGSMSTMKLQKLCYYSQGYSLAWDEKPLFDEDFEAWANGPVCYELFTSHRGRFTVADWPSGSSAVLTSEEKDTIDGVLLAYGGLSGQQLSDKTHNEAPWMGARADLPLGAKSNALIEKESMQDYFGSLVSAS